MKQNPATDRVNDVSGLSGTSGGVLSHNENMQAMWHETPSKSGAETKQNTEDGEH